MDQNKFTPDSDAEKLPDNSTVGESLEYVEPEESATSDKANDASPNVASDVTSTRPDAAAAKTPKGANIIVRFWRHFNIYLLLFVLLAIIATVGVAVLYFKDRGAKVAGPGTISQQNLPAETLQELASNGVQVGDPKQVLNVQSNSVFAGAVLVKGELQVAGGLKIGSGSLLIPEVNVGGSAVINQLQAQSLGVAGQGQINELAVLRNLNVNGSGTFNGGVTTPTLTVGKLQLNGDLSINRHLVAGGATPNRSNGNALGSGGTSSLSGSDTAGSISINTGSAPAAGCFLTATFTGSFTSSPHIVITPVGSAAASLDYYINRSTTSFSVCTTTPAPANSAFGFDYHVFD